MIEHIVLFQLKPEVSESEKETFIAALRGMKGRIPGMVDLSAGESFTERHQGYSVGLVVRFTDADALDAYGPHPVHAPIKQMADQWCDQILAVDYIV